jgi:DNA polymerase-3 subunit epsilon
MIHGIRPRDVEKKQELNQLWTEIRPLIDHKFIIAHNAGFDLSVLRKTLDYYSIEYPKIEFTCSYILSKNLWKGLPSYDLKTLCRQNNIDLVHHRAGHDSKACADLTIKIFDEAGVTTKDEIPEKLRTTVGRLIENKYFASETDRLTRNADLAKLGGDPTRHKPESIFYGKTVVFTGKLMSMIREEAQGIVATIGGINLSTINKKTNILVVGQQDYRVVGDDGMSSKQEKALKYVEEGIDIEIISEDDFLKNI